MTITHKAKAGALLTGTEYEATDAHLEGVTTVADAGSTETLDASASSVYDVTLSEACTFTLTGATDDQAATLTVILRGAFATTWPAEVTWLNGAPATGSLVVVTLLSVDGTNWLGTASREPGPVYDIERYTGGDVTVNSTSAGADMAGVSDVTVAAAAGDLVMIGVSFRPTSAGTTGRVDVKCITGATENYVSSLGTTPAARGISAWLVMSSTSTSSGEVPYVVQAADISSGNLTMSLRGWVTTSSYVITAGADDPLLFWVRNLGQ